MKMLKLKETLFSGLCWLKLVVLKTVRVHRAMSHHTVGIQKLMFIPQRHHGPDSNAVMGDAITHSPFLQRPGTQPKQQREDRHSYIRFCVLLKVSVTQSNFLKKPLIKKFNRRLNHIIQPVCFLFQIHSCGAIRPAGPRPAVLHTAPHKLTYNHTYTNSFFLYFFWFFFDSFLLLRWVWWCLW